MTIVSNAHGVTAIARNTIPWFSPQVSREMNALLAARYPDARTLGPHQLRWRE